MTAIKNPQARESGAKANVDGYPQNTPLKPACQDYCQVANAFFNPGEVCELRALGLTGKGPWEGWAKGTVSGYFDDPAKFAAAAKKLNDLGKATGIYFTLNPVNPALLARANNRLVAAPKAATADEQVVCHRWLLVDTDPERPSGISATDAELKKAITCRNEIADFLSASGFPEPMKAHSGNGGHLLYRLQDLPNTDSIKELKREVLQALSHKFGGNGVDIDKTVFNASRIVKLYGTWARKGDNTSNRPHRRSYLETIPDPIVPVTLEQLQWLARQVPEEHPHGHVSNGRKLNVEAYLVHYGVEISKIKSESGRTIYGLRHCVFDQSHTSNEASVIQMSDGKLLYQCFHNSCQGRTWAEARQRVSGDDSLAQFRNGYCIYQDEGSKTVQRKTGKALTGLAETPDEAKEPVIPSLLPVPVDAFPDDIQLIIKALAKAHGTAFEVAVLAVLAVSGSLIGWSRQLIVKDGWYVHAALYAATEAETGEGKSPTTDFLLKPVEKLERQEFLKYEAAKKEYLTELEKWQATKKDTCGQKPEPPPPRKRFKIGDCTIEAVADALNGNPKGLLWYREELNGLLLDLDKYTGKEGSTKTKLLEAYDLRPWQIDRVNKDRTTYIPKACLGVFGTIQPKILAQAFDDLDAASGFLPRFIIIYSAKTGPTLWSEEGINDSLGETWSRYVQALASYELELADDKDAETVFHKSCLVGLSEDAKSEYIAWYNQIAIQPWNNVADGLFKAIVPKMQEQALRICLILHCLESIAFGKDETLPVRKDTMQKALRLADWVWSHQKRMWSLLHTNTAAGHVPLEQRIAAAIIALEPKIENSVLLTREITEKLNEGLEKKYHIKPESVGHACAQKLKLQRGPDKNNRGWIITPEIIDHLKSVYGLIAKITAITARTAQNPHPQVNTDTGSCFATARTAQENTDGYFNRPTTARTLNQHQSGEKGSMGSSGGYLPETSNHPKTEMETPEDIRENLGAECGDKVDDGNAEQEVIINIW
jgi:hypothetical protein